MPTASKPTSKALVRMLSLTSFTTVS
jgi:hypothetical protein